MEQNMNFYETLFIVDVSKSEDATVATLNKFTSLIAKNGEIIEEAKWGKRRLAYPINDMNEGFYIVVTYKAPTTFIAELERLFNIDESIMRSLTLKLEHEPQPKVVEAAPVVEEVVTETVEVAVEETVVATEEKAAE